MTRKRTTLRDLDWDKVDVPPVEPRREDRVQKLIPFSVPFFALSFVVLVWATIKYPILWRNDDTNFFTAQHIAMICILLPSVLISLQTYLKARLVFVINKAEVIRHTISTFLICIMCLTSWSSFFNGVLDFSKDQVHRTTVVRKYRTSRGGSHIVVRDWHSPYNEARVFVYSDVYEKLQLGDSVSITTKKGLFNYEWILSVD
jgi:hypothetical protein